MKSVSLIDFGVGNLHSAHKAFQLLGEPLGCRIAVTSQASDVQKADYIVLPGDGAFGDCMKGLDALPGMRDALEEKVRRKATPFLGICVGMQMLFERSSEFGEHAGLGWLKGEIVRLQPSGLKVPHMGWNELTILQKNHPLLQGVADGDHAYFVHSFQARCAAETNLLAVTEYGGRVSAVVGEGHIAGTQFHPEKSQKTGLRIIENFLRM